MNFLALLINEVNIHSVHDCNRCDQQKEHCQEQEY